jgi:Domain of unknown function (DUF4157)
MTACKHDLTPPVAAADRTRTHRAQAPKAEPRQPALDAQPAHLAPGAGAAPQAQAAALTRASGGRLARAGAALLQVQRRYGNRYTQRLVEAAQRDREADRAGGDAEHNPAGPQGGVVDAALRARIAAARTGGRPLDRAASAELGQALGADLGQVRVHTDAAADRLSRSLHAEAFTLGNDIFFRANQFQPATAAGRRLLAHELTHVVQQGGKRSSLPAVRVGPVGDASEREADHLAGAAAHAPSSTAPPTVIQREYLITTVDGEERDVDAMTVGELRDLLGTTLNDKDRNYVEARLVRQLVELPELPEEISESETAEKSKAPTTKARSTTRSRTGRRTTKAVKPPRGRSRTGKKKVVKRAEAPGKQKGPEAPDKQEAEARAAGRFIAQLEEELRTVSERPGNGESMLGSARDIQIAPSQAIQNPALHRALLELNDAVGVVVQGVLVNRDTLIELRTEEESRAEREYQEQSEERQRLQAKVSRQREKMRQARTGLGRAHHRAKGKKYMARIRALPSPAESYERLERAEHGYRARKMGPVHTLAQPLDEKFKAVANLVGGKKALGLQEGVNPGETIRIIIQRYQNDLIEGQ